MKESDCSLGSMSTRSHNLLESEAVMPVTGIITLLSLSEKTELLGDKRHCIYVLSMYTNWKWQ